jgi:hypothetical protein
MMLEGWLADVDQAVRAITRTRVLDIRDPPEPALARTVAMAGFPAVLPLWSGQFQTVGLLATPLEAPEAWPAVILKDGQGLTLASSARTLLPQLMVQRALSNLPQAAERLAERWTDVGPGVSALHQTLGGAEEDLQHVAEVVGDPERRAAFTLAKGHEAAFERAHSTLFRSIDRSDPFRRYADWLDACIEAQWTAPDDPMRYGAWGRRVVCWASRLAIRYGRVHEVPADWMHRVIHGHAGLDSGVPNKASWLARVGAASGEAALVEAARSIDRMPGKGDHVPERLADALLAEGMSYRGLAHAEAVVALDERGEPIRAWEALQSAAWWAARAGGRPPEALLDGARFIASRHGWSDVQWVVEHALSGA